MIESELSDFEQIEKDPKNIIDFNSEIIEEPQYNINIKKMQYILENFLQLQLLDKFVKQDLYYYLRDKCVLNLQDYQKYQIDKLFRQPV